MKEEAVNKSETADKGEWRTKTFWKWNKDMKKNMYWQCSQSVWKKEKS